MNQSLLDHLREAANHEPAGGLDLEALHQLAHTIGRAIEQPVSGAAGDDYDRCAWLYVGRDATVATESSTSELRDWVVAHGRPLERVEVALSRFGPYAALRWQRWSVDADRRLEHKKLYRPATTKMRQQQITLRRELAEQGLQIVTADLLEAQLTDRQTELGGPATVGTILFSERW